MMHGLVYTFVIRKKPKTDFIAYKHYLSVTIYMNCSVARCLINVYYLRHVPLSGHDDVALFGRRRLWRWINTKIKIYVTIASLKS